MSFKHIISFILFSHFYYQQKQKKNYRFFDLSIKLHSVSELMIRMYLHHFRFCQFIHLQCRVRYICPFALLEITRLKNFKKNLLCVALT